MSILEYLIQNATEFTVSEWSIVRDDDPDSIPDPQVILQFRVWILTHKIDEELWHGLDNGFKDPLTDTEFYNHDSDEDLSHRYGTFAAYARTTDIQVALEHLKGEITAMEKWLTDPRSQPTTGG